MMSKLGSIRPLTHPPPSLTERCCQEARPRWTSIQNAKWVTETVQPRKTTLGRIAIKNVDSYGDEAFVVLHPMLLSVIPAASRNR